MITFQFSAQGMNLKEERGIDFYLCSREILDVLAYGFFQISQWICPCVVLVLGCYSNPEVRFSIGRKLVQSKALLYSQANFHLYSFLTACHFHKQLFLFKNLETIHIVFNPLLAMSGKLYILLIADSYFFFPSIPSLTCCSLKSKSSQFLVLLEAPGQRPQWSEQGKTVLQRLCDGQILFPILCTLSLYSGMHIHTVCIICISIQTLCRPAIFVLGQSLYPVAGPRASDLFPSLGPMKHGGLYTSCWSDSFCWDTCTHRSTPIAGPRSH